MRVSIEEFLGGKPPVEAPQPVVQEEPKKPGFFENVASDYRSRVDRAAEAQFSATQGEQSNVSGALQTIGQGAGFIGDLFGRAIGAVTPEFIKKPLMKGAEAVAESGPVQDVSEQYAEWKASNPEAAANLESVVNITSILPVAGVTSKAAQTGIKGALIGTGKVLEGAADAVSTTGRAVKGAGSVLYKSAITPNVKESERILNYRASSPFLTRVSNTLSGAPTNAPRTRAQTALERGIMGTETGVGVAARRLSNELWNKQIAPAVKNSGATMTKDELFAPVLARINATTDPTKRMALTNAMDALMEDYKTFPESFDLTTAQALKRDLDEFTPAKVFRGQDVANELRMLQHDMADAVRQKTYDSLKDEGIRQKYIDWANLHELEQIGVKAISEASFQGGSGRLVSGLWDMATVPVKTIGGQTLYRVGNKVEFVGQKGMKSFGQWLQMQGYKRPTNMEMGTGVGLGTTRDPKIAIKQLEENRQSYVDKRDAYTKMGFGPNSPQVRGQDKQIEELTKQIQTIRESFNSGATPELGADEWTGTKSSKPSTDTSTSISKKPTAKEDVSGPSIGTSGGFEGASLFPKSKIQDTLYHGTSNDFKGFERDFDYENAYSYARDYEVPEGVVFLSDDMREAGSYGPKVVPVNVDAKKVLKVDVGDKAPSRAFDDDYNGDAKMWRKFTEGGYDVLQIVGKDRDGKAKSTFIAYPEKLKIKATPTPSKGLEAEAKKYKSAEEFVKAQGTPVYHATDSDVFDPATFNPKKSAKSEQFYNPLGKGMYVSSNDDFVKRFGKNRIELVLPNNARVKTVTQEAWLNGEGESLVREVFVEMGYTDIPIDLMYKMRNWINETPIAALNQIDSGLNQFKGKKYANEFARALEKVQQRRNSSFDAIRYEATDYYGDADEILIINPSILKTRSQLTDIWKKANGISF